MGWVFETPTYELKPVRAGRLLSRFRFPYAYTVIKRGSSYENIVTPSIDQFYDETIDFIYQGGRVHHVTDQEAALLQAAGYTLTQE